MEPRTNLFHTLGDWWDRRQAERRAGTNASASQPTPRLSRWLPTRGNVLFTLFLVGLLVLAQTVGALPSARQQGIAPDAPSTGTIAYQGRLADADGNPLTDTVPMIFRLYDAASGGVPLWEEQWTGSSSVQVSDGLFNVMLGSLAPIPASLITSHTSLFLGITVGTDDEMEPRVQLGSVPFAVQAKSVVGGAAFFEAMPAPIVVSGTGDGGWRSLSLGHWLPADAKAVILGVDFWSSEACCNTLLLANGNEAVPSGLPDNLLRITRFGYTGNEHVSEQLIVGLSATGELYYRVAWVDASASWTVKFTVNGYLR